MPPRSPSDRQQVAIFSVLPPTKSGIAIYTQRLINALAGHVDVTCYYAGERPEGNYASNVVLRETAAFDPAADRTSFAALIYCLGNNPLHADHVDLALTCPDVVLLHEPRLANARRTGPLTSDPFQCADVCRAARQICVHSASAATIVASQSGRQATMVGPLAVPERTTRPTEPKLMVSAGIVAMVKHADLLVEAFGLVLERMPDARLAFVGPCGPDERRALLAIAGDGGFTHRVLITGEVSAPDYAILVGSASVAIQLRAAPHGESSAAVSDAIAAGVPTIVSDIDSFAEIPDDVVVRVLPAASAGSIADAIVSLATDAQRRQQVISAQAAYADENTFASAARRLISAVLA